MQPSCGKRAQKKGLCDCPLADVLATRLQVDVMIQLSRGVGKGRFLNAHLCIHDRAGAACWSLDLFPHAQVSRGGIIWPNESATGWR